MSIRSVERLTGVHRDTVMRLGARVGRGCAALHDRMMWNLRVTMVALDELWSFVGEERRQVRRADCDDVGGQCVFIALGSLSKAIISYRVGKPNREDTEQFVADLRERVTGEPQINSDAWDAYKGALASEFAGSDYGRSSSHSRANHRRMPPGAIRPAG